MPIKQEDVPRADGMPVLGLGTWQNDDHEQCTESVRRALALGYRHVDTAQIYRNEAAVGDAIEQASIPREDIFLATKVWIRNLSYEDVLGSTQASLERLGTDYLDLLYVHWPSGAYEPADTLAAFDDLYEKNIIRHVGVSNFEPEHIDETRDHLDAPVFANQVEMHPFLPQTELREYAQTSDIELVAYSPLARGDVLGDETLAEIADRHEATEAQVALAWLRENDVTAIPKATGEAHIRENLESLSLELETDELEAIDAISTRERKVQPEFAPDSWE